MAISIKTARRDKKTWQIPSRLLGSACREPRSNVGCDCADSAARANSGIARQRFRQRLAAAPAPIRSQVDELQKLVVTNRWSFQVGYTAAMDHPISELAGTRIPADLEPIATKQNAFAVEALRLNDRLLQANRLVVLPFGCSSAAKSCSYETKMTPVKSQGSCGSCWDFTAMGAWEGANRIQFNVSADTSEQQVLTCSNAGTCGGGWWDPVYAWMIGNGVGSETQTPYTGIDGPCVTHPPGNFKVAAWGFVTTKASVPTVQQLKQALSSHGPLAVAVFVTPAFQAYTSGVFNESVNNQGINHGVVLVGWDDAKGAWRIKNSWSTAWGEAGYMWIKYGANNIGYAATWVRPVAPRLVVIGGTQLFDLAKKFQVIDR
jgi:cathepsin L